MPILQLDVTLRTVPFTAADRLLHVRQAADAADGYGFIVSGDVGVGTCGGLRYDLRLRILQADGLQHFGFATNRFPLLQESP